MNLNKVMQVTMTLKDLLVFCFIFIIDIENSILALNGLINKIHCQLKSYKLIRYKYDFFSLQIPMMNTLKTCYNKTLPNKCKSYLYATRFCYKFWKMQCSIRKSSQKVSMERIHTVGVCWHLEP